MARIGTRWLPWRSRAATDHHHDEHGHTHGRVYCSIIRSRAGVRAVSISLAILAVTAALQVVVFALSGSVALLADLIHNGGDALDRNPARYRVPGAKRTRGAMGRIRGRAHHLRKRDRGCI